VIKFKKNNPKYKQMITHQQQQTTTISSPTITKVTDSKQDEIKCNHNKYPSIKSKLFFVSTTALFIVPSSYSGLLLPISPLILSILPIMVSLSVYTSSITQIHEIIKTKSTQNYSPIPFISLLNNAMIWGMYGILSDNPTIMITNVLAITSASVGMAVFKMNNKLMNKQCICPSLIFLSLAASYTVHNDYDIVNILGLIGCGTSFIAYASPLCVIKQVIQQKTTKDILPFGLSAMLTLNAATWSCYGWFITDDLYVWAPCLLGFGAGLVQLSLFAIY